MYNSSRILFQPFDCIKRLALYLQESLVLKVPFGVYSASIRVL